jgi:hypothetical protein
MPPTERAARLLVDLLGQVHDALLAAAVDDEALVADALFVSKLDPCSRRSPASGSPVTWRSPARASRRTVRRQGQA